MSAEVKKRLEALGISSRESVREKLIARVFEIDTVVQEVGFKISDLGIIERTGAYSLLRWKTLVVGVILYLLGLVNEQSSVKTFGALLCFYALSGPLKNLFETWMTVPHLMQLKEYDLELAKIRRRLFGRWSYWRLNCAKLDLALVALADAPDRLFKDLNEAPSRGRFKVTLDPDSYRQAASVDDAQTEGDHLIATVEICGCLFQGQTPLEDWDAHVTVSLIVHAGNSCEDAAVFYHLTEPEKSFPKAWARLHEAYGRVSR